MMLFGELCPEQHQHTTKKKEKYKKIRDVKFGAVYVV